MKKFLSVFFSEYLWFRKWHGGRWARCYLDHPVCSCVWMKIPDDSGDTYREPLWRGGAIYEDWK